MKITRSAPSTLTTQRKYELYESSVQNPEAEIDFVKKEFKRRFGRYPKVVREDFGGTGYFAAEWVLAMKKHGGEAYCVDLDPKPLEYGRQVHWPKLKGELHPRLRFVRENVLKVDRSPLLPKKVDVVMACNFSYMIFKERQVLLEYFKVVKRTLGKEGMFVLDLLGGPECQTVLEEKRKINGKVTYFWDCQSFNPLTSEVLFHIHYGVEGCKHLRVFTYDWRLWSLPELSDLLKEAGFANVTSYWEREDENGEGNGVFYPTKKAETCPSWVTYLVAH